MNCIMSLVTCNVRATVVCGLIVLARLHIPAYYYYTNLTFVCL